MAPSYKTSVPKRLSTIACLHYIVLGRKNQKPDSNFIVFWKIPFPLSCPIRLPVMIFLSVAYYLITSKGGWDER